MGKKKTTRVRRTFTPKFKRVLGDGPGLETLAAPWPDSPLIRCLTEFLLSDVAENPANISYPLGTLS